PPRRGGPFRGLLPERAHAKSLRPLQQQGETWAAAGEGGTLGLHKGGDRALCPQSLVPGDGPLDACHRRRSEQGPDVLLVRVETGAVGDAAAPARGTDQTGGAG